MKKWVLAVISAIMMIAGGVSTENQYLVKFDNNHSQSGASGDQPIANLVNIALNTTLPGGSLTLKKVTKSNPHCNLSYCKNRLIDYYPDWNNNCTLYGSDSTGTGFSNGEMFIEVEDSGLLHYEDYPSEKRWDNYSSSELYGHLPADNQSIDYDQWPPGAIPINGSITQDEAYDIAINYCKNHGGLPENWYLFNENTGVCYAAMGPHYVVLDYSFQIQRRIHGYPILEGDGIIISVTPLGEVSDYEVNWWNLHFSNDEVTVRTASEAIRYLDKNIEETHIVDQVELGYFVPRDLGDGFGNRYSNTLTPVWMVHFKDTNDSVCIDALDIQLM